MSSLSNLYKLPVILGQTFTIEYPNDTEEDTREETQATDLHPEIDQIIRESERKAQEMIQKANEKALEIIRNAKEQAQCELKSAYEQGYNEGFQRGFIEGKKEVAEANSKVADEAVSLIQQLNEYKDTLIEESRNTIISLAMQISEKIIKTELKQNSNVILSIFEDAVKDFNNQEWVKLTISDQDRLVVCNNTEALKEMVKGAKHIEINAQEDYSKGTCIIEVPQGIIDASVDTQIININESIAKQMVAV